MTVEDAVELMAEHVGSGLFVSKMRDEWAAKFVVNVAEYSRSNKPLSTEQVRIVLKVFKRVEAYFLEQGLCASETASLFRNPTCRQEPYPSANVPREVRFLGDNVLGFRFKKNDTIVADLKALKSIQDFSFNDLWFHREHRLWLVPVTRDSIHEIMALISRHRFDFDDMVAEYLTVAQNSAKRPSAFVADMEMGVIAAQVYDNEVVAWFTRNVLGGDLA